MAIDFSKIDIGKDVSNDIKRMVSAPEFYEKVVKTAAEIHIEDARKKTADSKTPTGGAYPSLSPAYKKLKNTLSDEPAVPNLRFGYDVQSKSRKRKAMDTLRYRESQQNRGAEIYFDGSADSSRMRSTEYMYRHHNGAGVKKRKIFPEDEDMRSPAMTQAKSKVMRNLTDYLNTPRRITIG